MKRTLAMLLLTACCSAQTFSSHCTRPDVSGGSLCRTTIGTKTVYTMIDGDGNIDSISESLYDKLMDLSLCYEGVKRYCLVPAKPKPLTDEEKRDAAKKCPACSAIPDTIQ